MSNAIDMTGQRFGRLTVIERAGNNTTETWYGWSMVKATWRCKCDCGAECIVIGANLRRGATRSCGCLRRDKLRERRRDAKRQQNNT